MRIEFDTSEPGYNRWYATTDDGECDAAGPTPLDAVSELAVQLEQIVKADKAK